MHLKIVGGPTGASTKIFVDGKPFGRCTAIKYEAKGGALAKVTMEIWPEKVEIEADVQKVRRKTKRLDPHFKFKKLKR